MRALGFRGILALGGLVFGATGIVATIGLYFVVRPVLGEVRATANQSLGGAADRIAGVSGSLGQARAAASSLETLSGNLDKTFENLETGTASLSSSLTSLSAGLAAMPGGPFRASAEQLGASAKSFAQLSAQMKEARGNVARLSNAGKTLGSGLEVSREGTSSTAKELRSANKGLGRTMAGLKQALGVGVIMLVLCFLALMSLSASLLRAREC